MKDLLIFIPGIMGSCLRVPAHGSIPAKQLWYEKPADSISQLVKNPSLYKWNPDVTVEAYSILSRVDYFFFGADIYGALRTSLKKLEPYECVEFPYDWRQDIRVTARQLGHFVSDYSDKYQKQQKTGTSNEPRLAIVGHSMGGLIGALALLKGHIQPENVRKFISVGTPFYGAPSAFKALYGIGYLPGMFWLDRAVNWRRNRRKCRQILLEAFQSFTSIYQLLPPVEDKYIDLEDGRTINPLSEAILNQTMKDAAVETHVELIKFPQFLVANPSVQHYFIYGDSPDNTDRLYTAKVSPTGAGYTEPRCYRSTHGDGTVPVSSACVKAATASRSPVVGSVHSFMCVDPRVIDLVVAYLMVVAKPTTGTKL